MRLFISLIIVVFFSNPIKAQNEENTVKETPKVELHGALRYNYKLASWKNSSKERGGDFGYDMFAISPKAYFKGLTLDVEYRLYAVEFGSGLLRRGDITYSFNDNNYIKVGLTKVPFGIEPYNSHSYYLGMGYYMGLEDDYDMGVRFSHQDETFEYQIAFFKNSEEMLFGDKSQQSNKRYSYDVIGVNRETNQINGKLVYKINRKQFKHRIGGSAMYGGLYNSDSDKMGNHSALAFHYELTANAFNLKTQVTTFKKNPKNVNATENSIVSLGAYNLDYELASKGELYTIGASYNFPINNRVIDNIQLYNNYAYFDKSKKEFEDSTSNTIGILFHAGNIYSYIEYIIAENQPWFGSEWTKAFSSGNLDTSIKKEQLFNINIGYYF